MPADKIPVKMAVKMAAQFLKSKLNTIADKDLDFVGSLVAQCLKWEQASVKQQDWVVKMAVKYGWTEAILNGESPVAVAADPEFESEPIMLPDTMKLRSLFKVASGSKLKNPRIEFEHESVPTGIKLWISGPSAKTPGAINVAEPGAYGSGRKFYGKIIGDTFHPSSIRTPDGVVELLHAMASDPVETIINFGKKTGNCAFCNSKLKFGKSVYVGYGRVCAANWGLPYKEVVVPAGFKCEEEVA